MIEKDNFKYIDYSEFWDVSLQKIEEIQRKLDKYLLDLEKKYAEFEDIYDMVDEEVNTLSSIYSSLNSINGREYLLKLKSLVKKYKKRYTREGIDFALINFLISKISEHRNKSFEDFPVLEHLDIVDSADKKDDAPLDSITYKERPYKWITFERNCSWFITPFNRINIKDDKESEVMTFKEPDAYLMKSGGVVYNARDIFSGSNNREVMPRYLIIIDDGERAFAADRIGKMIFSTKNFVTSRIEPFEKLKSDLITPGRLRIFGKKHIFL